MPCFRPGGVTEPDRDAAERGKELPDLQTLRPERRISRFGRSRQQGDEKRRAE